MSSAVSWLASAYAASSALAVGAALGGVLAWLVGRILDRPWVLVSWLSSTAIAALTVAILASQALGAIKRAPFDSAEIILLSWWASLVATMAVAKRAKRRRRRAASATQAAILLIGAVLILARNYLG